MSKEQQSILQELEKTGWILPYKNPPFRINQEKNSLQKCICRPSYLGRYDTAVRYCFFWLLERGYDIHPAKVHSVFRFMLEQVAGLSSSEAKEVIKCRHAIKYNQAAAGRTQVKLNKIIKGLSKTCSIHIS